MDELVSTFRAQQRAFGDRVHAIAGEQWSAPTPCSEWTVADLVGHVVEEHRWAGPLLHGLDLDAAGKVVAGSRSLPVDGGVGANLAEEWDEAAVDSADAFSETGAVDRTVALSRGDTPARQYISEMIFDLVLHGWDLERAIGYAGPALAPDDVVAAIYDEARAMGDDLSASGLFDAPVDVPDTASTLDRLVAFTGRDPNWTAPTQ